MIDGGEAPVISREEYDSLVLKLKETEIEKNKLARTLRATEKRFEVLRVSLETLSGLATTITDEKRKQEAYVNLLLRSCPGIIMMFDGRMRFLFGTDSIRDVIEVDDISLLQGRELYSIVERYAPPVFTAEILAMLEAATGHAAGETDALSAAEQFEASAGETTYRIRIHPFQNEAARFAGFLLIMHDITDLIAAREQAKLASRSKGAFLSRMSHEMRTPMNAIIGMTSIAKKTEDPARKDYCLDKIDNASTHLLGVINDVLDMAKIEADKLEITPHVFHFENMISNVAGVLSFRADEKKQRLIVSLDERIPQNVFGDELRIAQVLTNLLSNAVKFTPNGGTVTLGVKCLEDTASAVRLLVEVSDTGIGISGEQQARLFTAFEQAERVTMRKFGGTGLGLAISKRIVELMGGTIWIDSELGRGAVFAFTVTLQKSGDTETPPVGLEDAADTPAADYGEYSLLIAEDVEINREIISDILADMRFAIGFAVNGQEAVRMFKEAPGKYQMILMDVQMPEMDGYEATRAIRALPCREAAAIPIIAMTANVFKEDVDACLAAGMDAHLGKPINIGDLQNIFRKYLAK